MNLEHRLSDLERQNRILRRAFAFVVLAFCMWPLLSAMQGDAPAPSARDAIRVAGPNGTELRIENRADDGFGVFLIDKSGAVRGRLVLDGDTATMRLANKAGEKDAILEAGAESVSIGIRKDGKWRMRDELRGKVPLTTITDDADVDRLRIGVLKNEPVVSLRDREGVDRAWMVVEQGPHASVVVRGDGRAEAALHARLGAPMGFGLRSPDGKLKAGILADDATSQAFVYAPDENRRIVLDAREGRLALDVIDEQGRTRSEIGLIKGRSRIVQRDHKSQVFGDYSEALRKDGESPAVELTPDSGGSKTSGSKTSGSKKRRER